jgi:surfeit locus 1 family protein
MGDSSRRIVNYARAATGEASTPVLQKPVRGFRPRLLPTLAVLLLVPLFISLGQWQWNKASVKGSLQTLLDTRSAEPAMLMSSTLVDPQATRYRKLLVRGNYEPQYQILIDNRIYREQAGYHVLTPLRIEGSDVRVLVNRGWLPALAEHRRVPQVLTPSGLVEIAGMAIVPGTRFFTLGAQAESDKQAQPEWQVVWQNLDLARYAKAVNFPLQPVVIQLAPESNAGGFAREWPRPDERLEKHLSYALQWWGFAVATIVIWLVVNLRRNSVQ